MQKSFLKLTLLAAAGVAMLIGLGTWQLKRHYWKQALMQRIDDRIHAEPVTLAQAWKRQSGDDDIEYLRVRVSGEFDHARERHLYTVVEGKPGWKVITPLTTAERSVVFVDRGYVPVKLKSAEERKVGQIEGKATVTGLVRTAGRPNAFSPGSDAAQNIWYWRDLEGMAASVLSGAERERLAPFFVEVDSAPAAGGWPKGGVTRIKFANRHMEYVVTWYGLAVALVIIYLAILRRWRRHGEFT